MALVTSDNADVPTSTSGGSILNAALQIVLRYGIAALISIWLVWQLSGDIKADLRETLNVVKSHTLATDVNMSEVRFSLQALVNLQLQRCTSEAKNRDERDACFAAVRMTPR